MSGYGVLTANAFHLLDEENEDPQAILEASKVIAAKAEEKKKLASKEKPTAAPKPGSGAAARLGESAAPNGADRGPSDSAPRGRGGRYADRGRGRGEGRGRRGGYGGGREGGGGDLPDESYNAETAPVSVRGGRTGRGEGRAPRGAHIPRGGGHLEGRSSRRPYDRQDNTGRGTEREKRGGAGQRNWGKEGEEAAEVEEEKPVEVERAEIVQELTQPAEEPVAAAETAVPEAPQEEEEKEMSLEEWEALQAEKRATSTLNKKLESKAPKPDASQFKGMKAYEGRPEEDETDVLELTNKKQLGRSKLASERVRKEKEMVATSFRIGEEAARGGRGRGRGRGEGRFGGDRFGEGGGRYGDREGGRFGDREGGGRYGGRDGGRFGDREGGGRFGDREGGARYGDREDGPRSHEDRPSRGRGGGGGFGSAFGGVRGGGSGGRGRDGPAPELTDDSAFPSLSSK